MNDRSWDRLSGMIIGAAIGFIAGIMLAPTSGEETRESLKERTRTSVDQVRGSVTDLRENLAKRSRDFLRGGVTEIPITDSNEQTDTQPDEV